MSGVVSETIDRRHMSVRFDSDAFGRQTVASRYVLPRVGAIARPTLAVCLNTVNIVVCSFFLFYS